MNRPTNRMTLRAAIVALFALVSIMRPVAQESPLPLPPSADRLANIWAVTLAPGTNPDEVAARFGLINAGAIPGTPNTFAFRGAGEVQAATAETTQALTAGLPRSPEVVSIAQQALLDRAPRVPGDPLYPDQWHLNNTGQKGGTAGEDANVAAAWALGYTGAGVVVSSVDDGLLHSHADFSDSYLASASWDFVSGDPDPAGGSHGTNVGGVMAADNDATCGVGAAYNAQVTGARLLGGATDANEAQALSNGFTNNDFGISFAPIDIFNNSWGPFDNGATLEGPGQLTSDALLNGVTNGRGGLGSIYVWAAGNGKLSDDDVNADGYANSRFTISVAATTDHGFSSYYSEWGSANLINAPSNGGSAGITTTHGSTTGCRDSFGGTSSAAPLAAGIIALMLEANPNLTWRDVQHILVLTAEKNDPSHSDWKNNGGGLHFNHYYGFGRIDAAAAVAMATTWTNVGPEFTSDSGVIPVDVEIPDGPGGAWVEDSFDVTHGLIVESVDVTFNADHNSRGQLVVELVSPAGMTSVLMHGRVNDSGDDYINWRFGTVAHWGEESAGTWTIRVRDKVGGVAGELASWRLQIHGTSSTDTFITRHPVSQPVLFHEPVTLSVDAAGGEPIEYQWYVGMSGDTSNPIAGATSQSYTTPALTMDTQIWVRATGANSSTDSQTSDLAVVNTYDMLADPKFNDTGLNDWSISNSEGSILCGKKYVSASCAVKVRNTKAQKTRVQQVIDPDTYVWSFQAGDTLSATGQFRATAGAKARLWLIIRYGMGEKDKINVPVSDNNAWHELTVSHTLTQTNVTKVRVRIEDKSAFVGTKLWFDDVQLQHQRPGGSRIDGAADALPPPSVPDGFRGNN